MRQLPGEGTRCDERSQRQHYVQKVIPGESQRLRPGDGRLRRWRAGSGGMRLRAVAGCRPHSVGGPSPLAGGAGGVAGSDSASEPTACASAREPTACASAREPPARRRTARARRAAPSTRGSIEQRGAENRLISLPWAAVTAQEGVGAGGRASRQGHRQERDCRTDSAVACHASLLPSLPWPRQVVPAIHATFSPFASIPDL
jgi:hypothetical protein